LKPSGKHPKSKKKKKKSLTINTKTNYVWINYLKSLDLKSEQLEVNLLKATQAASGEPAVNSRFLRLFLRSLKKTKQNSIL
jgi:hypothetical protein